MKPKLLDLYSGAGGCATGYHRAGFDVVGVDHKPQPRYPFHFILADALMFLRNLISDQPEENGGLEISNFAVIHASPPCQGYSAMNRAVKADAPRLIPAVRELLKKAGLPYVIENVEGAELSGNVVMLCGTMFDGVRVRRHRLFEVHPPVLMLTPPCECRNGVMRGRLVGHRVAGKVAPGRTKPPSRTESDRRDAIGVPWMQPREARQAIPPAYTEWIGRRLMEALAP